MRFISYAIICFLVSSCGNGKEKTEITIAPGPGTDLESCGTPHSRAGALARQEQIDFIELSNRSRVPASIDTTGWPSKPWPEKMVWVRGGKFMMGGVGATARKDEFPNHKVEVDGFWIDQTEVTIGDFKNFVNRSGYVTTAEVKPDWEELQKQVPPGTPKPDESMLVPGSLVFSPTNGPVDLRDYSQWWKWVPGVNWRQPDGLNSDVFNTDQFDRHPVVQVSWYDAVKYASDIGKRLPTEAEWEYAARGGVESARFGWGEDEPCEHNIRANVWQGKFPYNNNEADGFILSSPVGLYEPNRFGLFDMMGNVWEWCSDWYSYNAYVAESAKIVSKNPEGPAKTYDPSDPYAIKKVVRGGSFLCNRVYCDSYRPSARMRTSPDSGENHTGFRCVMSDEEWRKFLSQQKKMASK